VYLLATLATHKARPEPRLSKRFVFTALPVIKGRHGAKQFVEEQVFVNKVYAEKRLPNKVFLLCTFFT
jgi:hypothetical protein